MPIWSLQTWSAAALLLIPPLALAFAGKFFVRIVNALPLVVRLALPALGGAAYFIATHDTPFYQPNFVAIYSVLPVALAVLLWHAEQADPEQRGDWRDLAVLAVLGLIVEFKYLEWAWPPYARSLNRLLLFDCGLYGFLVIRQLKDVGFNFWPQLSDLKFGLRELAFYAPIALPLGIGLGFLHAHAVWPGIGRIVATWFSIFAFIAILEETYFRGWIQNLLERRIGANCALIVTAVLFGLSHFNKGATHFNWRYVLMATFAGIFYGRAWRAEHRLVASAITHASVDTIWFLWLR